MSVRDQIRESFNQDGEWTVQFTATEYRQWHLLQKKVRSLAVREFPGRYVDVYHDDENPYLVTFRLGDPTPDGETHMRTVQGRRPATGNRAQRRAARRRERKYGVELEIVGVSRDVAAQAIRDAGVACAAESYNHRRSAAWKVVTDASVPGGCEVVSPPLRGEEGFTQIAQVCDALRLAGATVNVRCGLHVHVDMDGLTRQQITAVVMAYVTRQDAFDQLVSPSRRGNYYAQRWSETQVARVLEDFRRTGTFPRGGTMRYRTVNVLAFMRHGTMEFRQHQGTVNGQKVVEWVKLLLALVDAAIAEQAVATDLDGMLAQLPIQTPTRDWHRSRAAALR